MESEPLSQHIGAEVKGFDPAALGPAEAEWLRQALDRHKLLLFRNARLSDAEHIALVGTFGTVADEHLDGERISWVSNRRGGKGAAPGEDKLFWHSDYTFTPWPLTALSLAAVEIVGAAAPTRFANTVRAWSDLPEELQSRLSSLRALHLANFSGETADYGMQTDRGDENLDSAKFPHCWHPLRRLHPRTGEPLLFASEYLTVRIGDVPRAESAALLERMWETLYDPQHLYHHAWEEGDVVVWDNIALQHGRDAFAASEGPPPIRTLRRVAVSDHYDEILDSVPALKYAMTRYSTVPGFQG